MAGWRHWLTKYMDKESTFHNIATLHTTVPTQVATLAYFVSQCLHPAIPIFARFLLEIFYNSYHYMLHAFIV